MWERIQKRSYHRIQNQKGSMIIEYTIGLLVFIIFAAFCLDVLFIGHKHYYIGQEMANVSRILSVQSGTQTTTPTGYPGGSKGYQTSKEILTRFEKVAQAAGFKNGEWELILTETKPNGEIVRSVPLTNGTNFQADYLNRITVQFRGTYHWDVLSSGLPILGKDRTLIIERVVVAEFLQNYD